MTSALARARSDAGTVRQVAVPPATRALSALSRIDYEDAFLLDTDGSRDRTAEQWARAILEDVPLAMRCSLRAGWSAIGLKLDRGLPERSVLGWEIRRSTPELVVLGAQSRIGMPGELLFKREQHALLFASFVHHDNDAARAVWAGIESVHVRLVRELLEQAGRRSRP